MQGFIVSFGWTRQSHSTVQMRLFVWSFGHVRKISQANYTDLECKNLTKISHIYWYQVGLYAGAPNTKVTAKSICATQSYLLCIFWTLFQVQYGLTFLETCLHIFPFNRAAVSLVTGTHWCLVGHQCMKRQHHSFASVFQKPTECTKKMLCHYHKLVTHHTQIFVPNHRN